MFSEQGRNSLAPAEREPREQKANSVELIVRAIAQNPYEPQPSLPSLSLPGESEVAERLAKTGKTGLASLYDQVDNLGKQVEEARKEWFRAQKSPTEAVETAISQAEEAINDQLGLLLKALNPQTANSIAEGLGLRLEEKGGERRVSIDRKNTGALGYHLAEAIFVRNQVGPIEEEVAQELKAQAERMIGAEEMPEEAELLLALQGMFIGVSPTTESEQIMALVSGQATTEANLALRAIEAKRLNEQTRTALLLTLATIGILAMSTYLVQGHLSINPGEIVASLRELSRITSQQLPLPTDLIRLSEWVSGKITNPETYDWLNRMGYVLPKPLSGEEIGNYQQGAMTTIALLKEYGFLEAARNMSERGVWAAQLYLGGLTFSLTTSILATISSLRERIRAKREEV